MASVRAQIFAAVKAKLETVKADLSFQSVLVNPREEVGEDQMNALLFWHGGDLEPDGLTGHVDRRQLEFTVGWMVRETSATPAEDLLDAAFVAVSDALMNPADIQLSGLAIAITQGALSDPMIGRARSGALILGGQACDFAVEYLAREGDASTVSP
ncbi:hypothetical protein [Novosphingobium mangrovi (ex Huang et al. 2023)]|uniref:Uncharacterized protein n=1 Tax=Novosphingobium mangrovi (ex Huang et al. 2023) TaxID=2976432 RepID=A0ABT2I150_9SPHN|nr:hypothetical protein [Novosphingobium mangrovi (ex Huang et al. 2023)]MCT2398526.1 hypothetical protein [Novosphingobium mangrovi (ex Huang et al. 2023)]